MLDNHTGEFLVRTARKIIETWISSGKKFEPVKLPPGLREKAGVFTTIHSYPGHGLRGCIGYPEPVFPLIEALTESAISATRDPRFPPLSEEELGEVVIEVSVLTPPEPIEVKDPKEYPGRIMIGRDGLVIEKGPFRGLLLPQVPVEWKWDAEEFLSHSCMKAGLPPDSWLDPGTNIYRFRSEIFAEAKPRGKVIKVENKQPK